MYDQSCEVTEKSGGVQMEGLAVKGRKHILSICGDKME